MAQACGGGLSGRFGSRPNPDPGLDKIPYGSRSVARPGSQILNFQVHWKSIFFYIRYRIQSVCRRNYFRQTSFIIFWDESQTFEFILWILNFTVVLLHSQFDS